MVIHVLRALRNLIGDHEAIHTPATAGKPVLPHRATGSRSDFTKAGKPGVCNGGKYHWGSCLGELGPLNEGCYLPGVGVKEMHLPEMLSKST